MRKLTLTTCIAIALASAAVAGPVAMEKNVAPVAPACTWTGFYVGVNGGAGWQQSRWTNNYGAGYEAYYFGGASTTTWDNVDYLAGGQVGFNYQWRDLVVGIEADADYSGNTINKTRLYQDYSDETPENWGWRDTARIDFQGSARGRLGIAFLDNKALIYVTGGAAFVHGDWAEYSFYYSSYYASHSPNSYGAYDLGWKGDDWRWGLIGGAGIEYKLNCHWSIKAEGLYTWLAENEVTPNFRGVAIADPNAKFTFADELYSFRVGVNYAFTNFFGH